MPWNKYHKIATPIKINKQTMRSVVALSCVMAAMACNTAGTTWTFQGACTASNIAAQGCNLQGRYTPDQITEACKQAA